MEGQQLKCVNASDTNYLHSIERAIRIGEAVLLQVPVCPHYTDMSEFHFHDSPEVKTVIL